MYFILFTAKAHYITCTAREEINRKRAASSGNLRDMFAKMVKKRPAATATVGSVLNPAVPAESTSICVVTSHTNNNSSPRANLPIVIEIDSE